MSTKRETTRLFHILTMFQTKQHASKLYKPIKLNNFTHAFRFFFVCQNENKTGDWLSYKNSIEQGNLAGITIQQNWTNHTIAWNRAHRGVHECAYHTVVATCVQYHPFFIHIRHFTCVHFTEHFISPHFCSTHRSFWNIV